MTKSDKAPWNIQPDTVDEMVIAYRAQTTWEWENKRKAPLHWCIRLSHKFVENLCTRLIIAELYAEMNETK